MTFLDLLARWQQCYTLEHKRAFLTWITRPERETPTLDARDPARCVKQPVSPWFACCRAFAGEAANDSTGFANCTPNSIRCCTLWRAASTPQLKSRRWGRCACQGHRR
jgi:hypothetical protein